jgi:hypothetical protein
MHSSGMFFRFAYDARFHHWREPLEDCGSVPAVDSAAGSLMIRYARLGFSFESQTHNDPRRILEKGGDRDMGQWSPRQGWFGNDPRSSLRASYQLDTAAVMSDRPMAWLRVASGV